VNSSSATTDYYPERGVNEFLNKASTERNIESVSHRYDPDINAVHDERIISIAEALGHLRDFEFIRNLLTTYYSVSQASVIPSPMVLDALPSLFDCIASFNLFNSTADDRDQLSRLAENVLNSTSARINIKDSLSPSDFMGLYTGKNLRLEYIGIVLSVAARSCLIGLAKDGEQRDPLIRDIYRCSTTCLHLARELTPMNDILVWFSQDHLMLTACIEGYSSKLTDRLEL
jgi:hypothetical protein